MGAPCVNAYSINRVVNAVICDADTTAKICRPPSKSPEHAEHANVHEHLLLSG